MKGTKSRAAKSALLIFLSSVATLAGAQSSTESVGEFARETQMRGYWVDLSTGLVWAGKDNATDVNWRQATNYCGDLELAGYSNWRLPTIDELQGITDTSLNAPSSFPKGTEHASLVIAKGGLLLTANDLWSSSQVIGNPSGYAWQFNLLSGNRQEDPQSHRADKRALCVRHSDVALASQRRTKDPTLAEETKVRGYWLDSSTGLMWAGRDNGKDVTWGEARKYCRALRLAGYADWRLATLDELESLVVNGIYDPQRVGNTEYAYINVGGVGVVRNVRGGIYLAGDSWSSNRPLNRFHQPYSMGFFFNFITSQPSYDLQLFRNTKRVLCVRQP
jgi:hypothetical protein